MIIVQSPKSHGRSSRWIATLTCALLLCGVCIVASRSLRAVTLSLEDVAQTELVQHELQGVEQLLSDMERAAREYVITHDEALLQPYLAARPLLRHELDRLNDPLTVTGVERSGAVALAALAYEREAYATRLIRLVQGGEGSAARTMLEEEKGKSNFEAVRTVIASMEMEERRQLALAGGAVERSREVYVVALWMSGAVALLLLVAVAYGAMRRRGPLVSPTVDAIPGLGERAGPPITIESDAAKP